MGSGSGSGSGPAGARQSQARSRGCQTARQPDRQTRRLCEIAAGLSGSLVLLLQLCACLRRLTHYYHSFTLRLPKPFATTRPRLSGSRLYAIIAASLAITTVCSTAVGHRDAQGHITAYCFAIEHWAIPPEPRVRAGRVLHSLVYYCSRAVWSNDVL